nr:RcpC/CpaB family pilus assembly protein [Streptomyces sp. 840.1]
MCAPAPPPCGVPAFPPLRVRGGGGHRMCRAAWRRRRAMAAGLALTAAVLAVSGFGGSGSRGGDGVTGPGGAGAAAGAAPAAGTARERASPPVRRLVSAPVRIADAATVRLLRPGDRVDVIASEGPGTDARVMAKSARVAQVPQTSTEGPTENGALIVLSVPRAAAAKLAGAGVSAGLAVILC